MNFWSYICIIGLVFTSILIGDMAKVRLDRIEKRLNLPACHFPVTEAKDCP